MIWSFALAAIGVFGLWLAGRKSKWGWAVGIAAQFLWAFYALFTAQPGFLISCVAYGWIYAKNFIDWHEAQNARP